MPEEKVVAQYVDEPGPEGVVSALILSDGEVVELEQLEKADVKAKSNIIEEEDLFAEMYNSGKVYRPPVVLSNLTQYSVENPYHLRCINQKAADTLNGGWRLVHVDEEGNEVIPDSNWSNNYKKLKKFFTNCAENEYEFLDLAYKLVVDYLTYAMCVVEVVRDKKGEPAKLYHIPAHTVRLVKDISQLKINKKFKNCKYVIQRVKEHERVFKIFDERGVIGLREPHTKNQMTEVIVVNNYHVDGGKYGLPEWLPALKALLGFDKVAHYNIRFFDNEAVPRFAVIVQGGKLDEQAKKMIKTFFKSGLRGAENNNKTLVLTSGRGAEIKLVPLSIDEKDGSFRFYRKDTRDEIISAHGVPPHRLQVYDSGNSGTYSPSSVFELNKVYKYSIIVPLQNKIQSIFNRIIKIGFKIDNIIFKFNDLDIGEQEQRADLIRNTAAAYERYINTGIMTVDEVRQELGLEKYSDMEGIDPDIKEWAITPRPIYIIRQSEKQQGLQPSVGDENLNNISAEFDEKSKEVTQRRLNDEQISQLTI